MSKPQSIPEAGRRDALKKIALGTGALPTLRILGQGTVEGATGAGGQAAAPSRVSVLSDPQWKPTFFDQHQNRTLEVLTDLIIPATDTPGAKAALVNRYIDLVLGEEEPVKQSLFIRGLAWIDARSQRLHGKLFIQLSVEQQERLLEALADPANPDPGNRPGVEFFQELKDLTIFGYYTSRAGLEEELEYGGDDYRTGFPGACNHPEHQD